MNRTRLLVVLSAAHVTTAIRLRTSMTMPRSITQRAVMTESSNGELSVEQIVAQVSSNMNEGKLSTRGEGWFIGQACLVLGVLFAPTEPVAPVVEACFGLAAIGTGVALAATAISDLGTANLTPWPKPVESNELQTEGVYSLCRHPMYTSLITGCFGLSVLTLSFERLLLTVALFTMLSFKVGREEAFLNAKHGERYRAYSAFVPQFFPTVSAVRDYLGSRVS